VKPAHRATPPQSQKGGEARSRLAGSIRKRVELRTPTDDQGHVLIAEKPPFRDRAIAGLRHRIGLFAVGHPAPALRTLATGALRGLQLDHARPVPPELVGGWWPHPPRLSNCLIQNRVALFDAACQLLNPDSEAQVAVAAFLIAPSNQRHCVKAARRAPKLQSQKGGEAQARLAGLRGTVEVPCNIIHSFCAPQKNCALANPAGAQKKWRRRESNPRPKELSLSALHACPVICRHLEGRTQAPCSRDHLRLNLVPRRRSSTGDQPAFLTEEADATGEASVLRVLDRFRRRARAQRCRWRLLRCPVF